MTEKQFGLHSAHLTVLPLQTLLEPPATAVLTGIHVRAMTIDILDISENNISCDNGNSSISY